MTLAQRRIRGAALAAGLMSAAACADPDAFEQLATIEDQRRPDSAELVAALQSGDRDVRVRAVLAMGRIQSPHYVDALAGATAGDEAIDVRRSALFALGQLGLAEGLEPDEAAVAACRAALDDERPEIVADAVECLGKLAPQNGRDEIVDALSTRLGHAAPIVRAEAAHALFRSRFAPVWRRQLTEEPGLPPAAVRALLRALGDEDPAVRRAAAHAFSRYGMTEPAAELLRAAHDPDEWVRLFAARAVARSSPHALPESWLDLLRDPSAAVRREALVAVAACRASEDRGATPRCVLPEERSAALARDPSLHVRAALASAERRARGAPSLQRLQALERDPSPTVVAAAIAALADRLGSDYVADLEQHLDDPRWPVRVAAVRAAKSPAARRVLERARGDASNNVRVAALEVVGRGEALDPWVREALESSDLALRGTALALLAEHDLPDELEHLERVYRASAGDAWIEIREAAVEALGELSGSDTLLRRIATEDEAASVRGRARVILERRGIEPPPAAPTEPPTSPFLVTRFAEDPAVVLETSKGEIEIRCHADRAPVHVASFVELVRSGYYDGLSWHRVVPNFVIQGGDPRGDGWGGAGYLLRDEIHRTRFVRGTVGMPKAGKDTGGGQIFITHVPTPHLDGNYTIFGNVTRGLDVVDRIEVGDTIVRAVLRDAAR